MLLCVGHVAEGAHVQDPRRRGEEGSQVRQEKGRRCLAHTYIPAFTYIHSFLLESDRDGDADSRLWFMCVVNAKVRWWWWWWWFVWVVIIIIIQVAVVCILSTVLPTFSVSAYIHSHSSHKQYCCIFLSPAYPSSYPSLAILSLWSGPVCGPGSSLFRLIVHTYILYYSEPFSQCLWYYCKYF